MYAGTRHLILTIKQQGGSMINYAVDIRYGRRWKIIADCLSQERANALVAALASQYIEARVVVKR
jgi:hypothetical protein